METRHSESRPVRNETRGKELAARARLADSYWSRFVGLLGTSSLPQGEALILDPCGSIHTFFMRYPIDVLFLDKQGKVVGSAREIAPWRMSRIFLGARVAVELPSGTIDATGTMDGDMITFPRSCDCES